MSALPARRHRVELGVASRKDDLFLVRPRPDGSPPLSELSELGAVVSELDVRPDGSVVLSRARVEPLADAFFSGFFDEEVVISERAVGLLGSGPASLEVVAEAPRSDPVQDDVQVFVQGSVPELVPAREPAAEQAHADRPAAGAGSEPAASSDDEPFSEPARPAASRPTSRHRRSKEQVASSLLTGATREQLLASLEDYSDIEIPDWFGLDLFPYQAAGIRKAMYGFVAIADEPGLGKSRQGLGVAACWGAERTIVLSPPSVLMHWRREALESRLHDHPCAYRAVGDPCPSEHLGGCENLVGDVVMLQAGRKMPEFPAKGVIVVPDSLVTSKPALRLQLADWDPQVILFDEAHRAKNLESQRSNAVRQLAQLTDAVTVAITGTPVFATPAEIAPLLEFTGHMESVFGSTEDFLKTYCTTSKRYPGKYFAKHAALPQLRRLLDEHVWVRRTKDDLQVFMEADGKDPLPPKIRGARDVAIDAKLYREERKDVERRIDAWLRDHRAEHGAWPDDDEVQQWASDNPLLITQLRRAAGLAKAGTVAQMVTDWMTEQHARPDCFAADGGYDRPLLIWTHHHDVTRVVADAVMEAVARLSPEGMSAETINGSTRQDRRFEIVDAFQAGRVPVLIASMAAAGVGLTLTRGSDQWIVEPDWTPAVISQAEDRQHRISQTRPVFVTTLLNEETLDPAIQATLTRKIKVLDVVMAGGDHHVAVEEGESGTKILARLALERRAVVSRSRRKAA